eukprot:COSAG05_NODE_11352_length_517_cov_1.665072_2_plen_64_part_01
MAYRARDLNTDLRASAVEERVVGLVPPAENRKDQGRVAVDALVLPAVAGARAACDNTNTSNPNH